MKKIKVTRTTTESRIVTILDFAPVRADYREKINTPIKFLNHMIEHIVWRGEFNIEVEMSLGSIKLDHVICEDLGVTIGKAVAEYIKRNTETGVHGYGSGVGIIDEAQAHCAISFESRAFADVNYGSVKIPPQVEGMLSEDLKTFIEGFAQGAKCTIHVDIIKGDNAHHIWEAAFRSFGIAIGKALKFDATRAGMTSGVAGQIKFDIE